MSTTPLRRIVYRSHAAAGFDLPDLLALMVRAREANAARRITGLLVHQQRSFLQVLEGPSTEIEDLWQTIQRDRRHEHVELLDDSVVGTRWFGDWSMELADGDRLPGRYAGVWTTALAMPLAQVGDFDDAKRVLRSFADAPA